MKRILVVSKDPKVCEDLRGYFDPCEYTLLFSYDPKNIAASIIKLKPELIILDLGVSHPREVEILEKLKELHSNLPIIAITDASSNLSDVDMTRKKVYSFVKRPIQPERLSFMAKEALSIGINQMVHTTAG
ncbi:MAG: response regulator, partial [Candidatus Zixiibacteriota bacterium]